MPPSQFTTADGSLTGPVDGNNKAFSFSSSPAAADAVPFLNGLLLTEPGAAVTAGDRLTMTNPPAVGSTVTVEAFVADPVLGVNAPTQYSTANGSITGALNGINSVFRVNAPLTATGNGTEIPITSLQLWWNGAFQAPGINYFWSQPMITFLTAPVALTTATATSGGTVLTVASGTGIAVNQLVVGQGIQPGTYVVSGAGLSWVISLPTTLPLAATAVSFNRPFPTTPFDTITGQVWFS